MNSADSLQINKSRLLQKLFVYNPLRVYLQRKIEAPEVLTGFSLPAGSRCIEIGCGHGAGALLISRYCSCGKIVGVDNDSEIIDRARQYVSRPPAWAKRQHQELDTGRFDALLAAVRRHAPGPPAAVLPAPGPGRRAPSPGG